VKLSVSGGAWVVGGGKSITVSMWGGGRGGREDGYQVWGGGIS
jgi:hypothetical protein